MPEKTPITLRVNGETRQVNVWPMERLLDVLRRELGLTGTKEGCGEGECGACAVIFNGRLVTSCLVPVLEADGGCIMTIEGLAGAGGLADLQRSFVEHGGTQCGFCTPGMIMAAKALCVQSAGLDEAAVREGLSGNLCRCTGYGGIVAAVMENAGREKA
ncbi:MAG: (2Fe-2S)-binding protein [Acidobacteria bacterium]|nr:(2Fe-2S)-binding protein [Acidobacteriota bacterium]